MESAANRAVEGFPPVARRDYWIALALAGAVWLALVPQLMSPGLTWDEAAPNFPAAKNQAKWIEGLFTLPAPFSRETIDEYWTTTSDHPSLPRTVAAVSLLVFRPPLDEMAALRLPSAVWFSLLTASLYLFLRLFFPLAPSLAGAMSLALMPRVFGHAHFFGLDVPMMAWWFWTAAAGYMAMEGRLRPVWFGLAYALAFSVKLHAVFLPFPLLAWAAVRIWTAQPPARAVLVKRLLQSIAFAALLVPAVYIGTQPWLWHDTATRVAERFFDYAEKSGARPIALHYLGTRYLDNTPWHYPFVMIAVTVPAGILVLMAIGLARPLWERAGKRGVGVEPAGEFSAGKGYLFVVLNFLAPPLVVLLPMAQAYDGCRLFLPCFPFAAALAGAGFAAVTAMARPNAPRKMVTAVLFAAIAAPPLWAYAKVHPYYLSYYNEAVGGVRGAHRLGFESAYWCDAVDFGMIETINRAAPPSGTLKTYSMPVEIMQYYQGRGWLREDIQLLAGPPWDLHLLHCRQGMFRQTPEWRLYYRGEPIADAEIDGVPLALLYGPVDWLTEW